MDTIGAQGTLIFYATTLPSSGEPRTLTFITAMLALISSLLIALREMYLATSQLRIGQPEGSPKKKPVLLSSDKTAQS
ncbi:MULTISPECIES: hypothetical protein [Hydrocarboniphaga]|uniref:hypothetical protein n=1 Tax=Hydrocarboniphaga TaxID=243627 RepID=UPI0012F981A3|nr:MULTISPECIES: hypothetical protein [Hydrocarboniphaga]MDZ4079357.1 hypothetical protein [Hydrocarboniphaga sp.]